MSDREQFIALLDRYGVAYETADHQPSYSHIQPNDLTVCIPSYGEGGRNDGYSAFFAAVEFDEAGNFLKVGVWE